MNLISPFGINSKKKDMANPFLLKSSLILGLITILSVELSPVPSLYRFYLWLGVITSILNHGITSHFWKAFDRLVMAVFIIPDINYILSMNQSFLLLKTLCLLLIFGGVISFFGAKLKIKKAKTPKNSHGNPFHFAAHIFVTSEHVLMAYYFSQIYGNRLN